MIKFKCKPLSSSLLLAALMAVYAPWASALVVSQFEVKTQGEISRLTVESPVGMLLDAGITGRGSILQLRLKGADRSEIATYLESLPRSPAGLKAARLLPGIGDELRVLLEFHSSLAIVDETILAMPGKYSRWEIVVGHGDKPVGAFVAPSLSQIDLLRRDGRLDLVLSGSAGLVAEASFADNPSRLLIDLPEVSLKQASAAAGRFHSEASLIRSIRAVAAGAGSRLIVELADGADLVDTRGHLIDGQGQLVLSLVPDSLVQKDARGKLSALGFEVGAGSMQMRLLGIEGGKISAYTIEEPPRLVVDFLGWKPEQVQEALVRFGSKSMAALGEPRLDTTRLGSARAVFDLAASAPFRSAKALRLPIEGAEGFDDNYLISLAPGAESLGTIVRRGPLDLRFRRELQDGRQSEVVIRPPSLENAARYAMAAMRQEQGRDFALLGMLDSAREADAKYLAAKAEFEALKEAVPQARAGYLPTASFDYQRSSVHQNVTRSAFPAGLGKTNFPNTNFTLTITQPIFKPQAWLKMNQAELAVNQASLNLLSAEQDLIMRVSTAYLNLLAANDGIDLARTERQATEKQFEEAKLRMASGLGTLSQLTDTEARLSLNKAREIEAQNRVDDARLALKEIVGENIALVNGFTGDFDASMPMPSAAESWVEAALDQNLALQARLVATEIASLEVTRQKAGHLPVVSLTGAASHQDAEGSLYGKGQKSTNKEFGLRLTMPITDGGMTLSLTREAVARKEKALQEKELEWRRTERLARSAYNGVVTTAKILSALRQAVIAQESALETRLEGYNSGLFNVVAVMDAYRLYYTAQRDYLQSRYDYLLNRLKLKQAVGTLSRTDLEDIDALMRQGFQAAASSGPTALR